MSRRRHTLSTHLIRVRARAARRHYMRLQAAARAETVSARPGAKYAAEHAALGDLDLGLTDVIHVEKANHQRGKWVVVALPAAARPHPNG